MTDPEIAEQMESIQTRLVRLEQLLGIAAHAVVEPPKIQPVVELAIENPVADEPDIVTHFGQEISPIGIVTQIRQTPPPLPPTAFPRSPLPAPGSHSGLEQTIGLKWAGWVGAVVLVVGAAFGIKFGYEQGWFSIVTPTVRLCLLALIAFALIALGEWVYRKVNTLSAAGLFGAGVALLFVISYAGYAYYGLYERNIAFTFMALSTVIGAGVARRGQMVSIAVLAMIGGNIAPALLTNAHPEYFGFFIYLLLLQLTALLLAGWGATPKWWALRGVSLATTSLWTAAVINVALPQMTLIFSLIYAALFHAELQFSARRSRFSAAQAGVTFSLLVTTALTAAIVYLQSDASQTDRLISLLGLSLIFAIISAVTLRVKQGSAVLRALAIGYMVQSMALLAVAVPIAFSGIWITLAWSVLAVVLAAVGRTLNFVTAKYAAPVAWVLAAIHLFIWTAGDAAGVHRGLVWFDLAGYRIPVYLLMSGVLALSGRAVARLNGASHPSRLTDEISSVLNVAGGVVWMIACTNALSSVALTASFLFYANLLLLEDWIFPEASTLTQAAIIVVLAVVKWAAVDTLLHRLNDPVVFEPMVLGANGFIVMAILLSLTFLYLAAATPRGVSAITQHRRRFLGGLILGVILWVGSFSIDRYFINDSFLTTPAFSNPEHAEQVSLSMFWSVFAIAMIAAGFVRKVAGLRYFGLAIFAITLLKVVIIDLSQVSTGFRILSFMVLGLLLLGTSVLYGKVSPKLLEQKT